MKLPVILAFIGFFIMLGAIGSGFIWGDFLQEGAVITSVLWGKISLIDVYIGFFMFIVWVIYRERSVPLTVLWVIGILVLGNLTACFYLILALLGSRGDMDRFFKGRHAAA